MDGHLPESRERRSKTFLHILLGAVGALAIVIVVFIVYALSVRSDVEMRYHAALCMKNLSTMGRAIEAYYKQLNRYPRTRSGIQFLLAPMKDGVVEHKRESIEETVLALYVCPGDEKANAAVVGRAWEVYGDLEKVGPSAISYAGRNTVDHPLDQRLGAIEAIACCTGHGNTIHVLFLDGCVNRIELADFPDVDASNLRVGPESQIPCLRTLNRNP